MEPMDNTNASAASDEHKQWLRDADAGLLVYPGNRTREQWAPIAEASYAAAADLPED